MDECEEGEILDFDDEDDVYTPLERPSRPEPPRQQQPPAMIESESDESPESSSDSDSDSGPRLAKKRKIHRPKPPHQSRRDGPPAGHSGHSHSRSKKYNIWTASIQEETITTELENIDGLHKFSRERGVESYDFTQGVQRDDDDEDEDLSNDGCHMGYKYTDTTEETPSESSVDLRSKLSNKRRFEDRGHVKQRLGRRPSPSDRCRIDDEELYQGRVILDLCKTTDDSNEDVAQDIANKLLENKEDLIVRVVNVLGKERAISLYEETQRIEAQGGMLIMNGSRRRSPGGVFLFILKGDDTISDEQKNNIFVEDRMQNREELRKIKKARQRKRIEQERQKLKDDGALGAVLPDLLTRAELVVHQASGKNSQNCDGTVSNPPPSPATDNRGESSNDSPPHHPSVNHREVAGYDDDFLNVYAEGMDEF